MSASRRRGRCDDPNVRPAGPAAAAPDRSESSIGAGQEPGRRRQPCQLLLGPGARPGPLTGPAGPGPHHLLQDSNVLLNRRRGQLPSKAMHWSLAGRAQLGRRNSPGFRAAGGPLRPGGLGAAAVGPGPGRLGPPPAAAGSASLAAATVLTRRGRAGSEWPSEPSAGGSLSLPLCLYRRASSLLLARRASRRPRPGARARPTAESCPPSPATNDSEGRPPGGPVAAATKPVQGASRRQLNPSR